MRNNGRQDITIWAKTGENSYGEETYAAAVLVKGRWEDRSEQVRTPDNEEITSKAIVWPMRPIKVGDRVAKGDFSAITVPQLAGALEVQAVFETPSLRTNEMEYRAVL